MNIRILILPKYSHNLKTRAFADYEKYTTNDNVMECEYLKKVSVWLDVIFKTRFYRNIYQLKLPPATS